MAKLSKDDILKAVEDMTVVELADLVKALEEKFGVSATPVATPVAATGGEAEGKEEKPEKAEYDVVLTEMGTNKIAVIKAVREINQTLGLQEAKTLVETAPKEIVKNAKKKDAEEAKKKLEAAGAKVELK